MANEFKQFMGLLIFGNIENLILSAQGATAHVDPFIFCLLYTSDISYSKFLIKSKFNPKKAKKYMESYDKILEPRLFDKNYYLKAYPHICLLYTSRCV